MAKSLVSTPQQEQELLEQITSPLYYNNPLIFVMSVFPWGVQGTPLEHFTGPREWQQKVLVQIGRHVASNHGKVDFNAMRLAIASGRGIGKSALVGWIILWMLSTRIGSSVIVSANSENQLRSVTWAELMKWSTMASNAHWWEPSATKLVPAAWLTEIVERDLKIGTRYWSAEGKLWSAENPDGYAGPHNMLGMCVIFDEAASIPDGIWSVAGGFFTENTPNRFWFAFSNPRRNTGYFFECFGKKRDFWLTDNIDARTVEGTDKAMYEQIIAEFGEDSYQARVEVYGQFPLDDEGSFISPTLVMQAFARKAHNDPSAPIIMGIDPARSGADSTVIVVRQGRDIVAIERHSGDDTMRSVGNIIDAIERYKPQMTCIDEGGVGAGIYDRLIEQRYKVRGVNFGWKPKNPKAHLNKRAEIWCAMRDWLKTASIEENKRLMADLTGVRVMFTSSGAIQLESKKDMKARGLPSPDIGDAIAVTFAFPVARKEYTPANTPRSKVYAGHRGPMVASSWMGH